MSRKECKHGSACGHDLCPVDDHSGLVCECGEYEDSGWRRTPPRSVEVLRKLIAEKKEAYAKYKSGSGGFRFGMGKIAQKEAQRRRAEIKRLENEIGYRQ